MRLVSARSLLAIILACSFSSELLSREGDLKIAQLGDLKLESGEVLKDAKIGYRTFGKLNKNRSNAILFPTWFTGKSAELAEHVGSDKMLDPKSHFVVLIDSLGNGVSSSPSNSASQPKAKFPKIAILDMVRAEHLLATKELGLSHVRAVMGISMGGMQTFQWLVSYPDFMDLGIPIAGTPKQSSYDLLLWTSMQQSILTHLKFGDEKNALADASRMSEMALTTPANVRSRTNPSDFQKFIAKSDAGWKKDNRPYDYLSQLGAMIGQDILKDSGANKIKAKLLVVVAKQDHMVNPHAALELAKLKEAKTLVLEGDCGHIATVCEEDLMVSAVRAFLAK